MRSFLGHLISTTIGLAICFAQPAPVQPDPKSERLIQIKERWSPREDSVLKKASLYTPRVLRNVYQSLVQSKMRLRAYRLGRATKEIFSNDSEHWINVRENLADSIINPGGALNDFVSDLGAIVKSPSFGNTRGYSHRVRVCTENLAIAAGIAGGIVMPLNHVGVLIDDEERFVDSGGGELLNETSKRTMCKDAPIQGKESESAAIETLECVARNYRPKYSVLKYNCGAFTRDVLSVSGFGFPDFPNLGIGSQYRSDHKKELNVIAEECKQHTAGFIDIVNAAEAGEDVSGLELQLDNVVYSRSAKLQLLSSLANGHNPQNIHFLQKLSLCDASSSDHQNETFFNGVEREGFDFLEMACGSASLKLFPH